MGVEKRRLNTHDLIIDGKVEVKYQICDDTLLLNILKEENETAEYEDQAIDKIKELRPDNKIRYIGHLELGLG